MRPARPVSLRLAFVTASTAALLGACGGSSTTSATIGATGGTVTGSNGTSVTIPAGALSQNTLITVTTESNTIDITNTKLVGPVYRFGPEGTQFAVPVTVTVSYEPSALPSGTAASSIVMMTAPASSTDYTALTTTIADSTHVSAQTPHFSDFVATVATTVGPDQGVVVHDQGSSGSTDLAGPNGDLGATGDLAEVCQPTFDGSINCTMTSAAGVCEQFALSLNCAQTVCFCSGGNQNKQCEKPAPYAGQLTCMPQDVVLSVWTSCCGFPG